MDFIAVNNKVGEGCLAGSVGHAILDLRVMEFTPYAGHGAT